MSPRASLASELTARVAAVAVDAVADRPERTFSYLLPSDLGEPAPGSLVLVPYGSRLALGYLIETGAGNAKIHCSFLNALAEHFAPVRGQLLGVS